jgi:hypothetical protein
MHPQGTHIERISQPARPPCDGRHFEHRIYDNFETILISTGGAAR